MDSDSELLMAVTPRSRRKESIVNIPTCISYLDLEINGRKENIPYMITHDKTFPSTFNITFTGAIGQQRKIKIKEEWCRNHPKVQLVDRTKIRTSAARSMHSKLRVFHCDCYMQNLIKGPRF